MANQTPKRDWDAWWRTVWTNLFHFMGIVAVLGGFGFFAWATVSDALLGNRAFTGPPSEVRKAKQLRFQSEVLGTKAPCAVKRGGRSDVSNCSLMGLRLGMTLEQVERTLDDSGYSSDLTHFTKGCPSREPHCVGYVYQAKDGISISTDFIPDAEGNSQKLSVSNIALWMTPGANPYFDPENIKPVFVRLFGPPDHSIGVASTWGGGDSKTQPTLNVYFSKGRFAAILGTEVIPLTSASK